MNHRPPVLLRQIHVLVASGLAGLFMVLAPAVASAADTSPPSEPGVIAVSAITESSASLSWAPSVDNVGIEGYRVYRGTVPTSLTFIAAIDDFPSYSATPLYSGTSYTFGVTAIDAANNESPMRTTTFTTATSSDTTAPSAPSSPSVSGRVFSSSRIDLVWAASSSADVAGYNVIRDGTQIARVDLPNSLRYSDTGLAAASSYVYTVSAVDSAGNVSPATTGRTVKTLATGALLVARGPYLSNVTGTSAVVSWWTNLATPGVVSWGLATPTEHALSDPAGTVQHHSVTISGLSPSSTYKYRIGDGASLTTSDASFATAATPGQTFTFAAIGDFGGGSPGETQNANNITVAGTAFVQTVGDNIYPSAGLPDPDFNTIYSDFDERFYKPFASVINSQSFFPANGNKEYYGNGEFWANFPMPGANHSYYSYDWGDAHILVLDGEQPMTPTSPQYQFAQTDLAAHQASVWRIVSIQRPPYSSSSANSSSVPVRTNLVPLFQQQNVNLVLSGNSHNYERSLPLINDVPTTNGITYIVTGAGGNGFNSFTIPQPTWSAFRAATIYEYARVTVSPSSLVVDAIRADTAAVLDTTTIHVAGPTKPPAPTNLTATPGNAQVSLSWTAATGATTYNVKRGTATGGPYTTVSPPNLSATTYTDTGLSNGTAYFYVVTAVNSSGESGNSNQATATTTPPPPAPTNLTATPGNAQVSLSWTASTGASTYNVKRGTASGGPYTTVSPPNLSVTTYTDTGLTKGTAYFYVVTAVSGGGESGDSNQATATTTAPPLAPTHLTATPGNAQASLSWTASTGATGYKVKRGSATGGPYTTVSPPNLSVTTYTDTGLTNGTVYFYVVTAVNSAGESGNSNQAISAGPLIQNLLAPQRLADTRTSGGPIATGTSRCFPVTGVAGIPGDAAAVVLNVTAVGYANKGWLTVYPNGQPVPSTSTLNFDTHVYAMANGTVMRLGTGGQVCVGVGTLDPAHGKSDVILDATGYLSATALGQLPMLASPQRLSDTRTSGGPIATGTSRCFPVAGLAGIPGDAAAVVLTATAVGYTTNGWLTVYPDGQAVPATSMLNFDTSEYAIANGSIMHLGPSGQVCVKVGTVNSAPGSSQVILDVTGYLTTTGLVQLPMLAAPQRVVDTRTGSGPIASGQSRCFPIAGLMGVPSSATAVVLNVTTVGSSTTQWLTAYPNGEAVPPTSTLNFDPAEYAVANSAIVRVGTSGQVCVNVGTVNSVPDSAQVILDVVGYQP